ncbi:MAG: GyrI-like domain-containing protein [Anaerolineaceae bacterium]
MEKIDWKKTYKELYFPPSVPVVVEVPPIHFLMINGHGDPNKEESYQKAVEMLFSLSYTLKFAVKKERGIDYSVFPLEGLWWVKNMARFTTDDKASWDWTMMIAQPETVNLEWVERARSEVLKKKKDLNAVRQVRFEPYREGLSIQLMHIGPYSAEGPNVARLHAFIHENGYAVNGKHHEIYLSDVRRSAPEKLKTVIRQPICLV